MIKLGCCTWNFATEFPFPPEPAIRTIGALGFAGFELIVFSREELQARYSPVGVQGIVALYQSLGLALSELVVDHGALRGLASLDTDRRRDALDTFALAASIARDLGAPLINFVPHWAEGLTAPHDYLPLYLHPVVSGARSEAGPTWRLDLPPRFAWAPVWENYIESLADCVTIAEARGLRIAIEPHPLVIVSNTDSVLRLLDRLPSPTLGVNFDTAMQAAIQREYPPISIFKLGQKILHVHARDTDGALNYSVPAGLGILDWPEILRALKAVNYAGFISIELGEHCREPGRHLQRSRAYLQTLLDEIT